MTILIVSSSLNPDSKSRILGNYLKEKLIVDHDVDFVDLNQIKLPLCDGASAYSDNNVIELQKRVEAAQSIVFAMPIYNYSINAVAKNFIELMGKTLTEKLIGFVMAAGGANSYMSVMNFANSLMLDFRCIVIPRFVYAQSKDFNEKTIGNEEIVKRLNHFMEELTNLHEKLK